MEIDNLKSVWKGISTPQKNKEELNALLKKYSYPMLSSIKKQLIIETTSFTAFLFCYFSMFDGDTKPLFVNLMIIFAILLQLLYGYKGYLLQSQFRGSTNVSSELEGFISKLKSYRIQTVFARIFFAFSLFLFFTYVINFSESRWWATIFIVEIFIVQIVLFYRIWSKRINKLKLVLQEFGSSVD